ncbi:hypothetical protein DP49_1508 [Burkholderia pseudomallei]|nr:hypothetical protein DP49_1508 [Burkholderia pseudomallei]KGS72795.1 hypothetical protein X942_1387 [Burkholderia pseudomallei MSHR5596]
MSGRSCHLPILAKSHTRWCAIADNGVNAPVWLNPNLSVTPIGTPKVP